MRKTVRALMLVMALSVCVYAGDMGNGVAPPSPQQQQTSTTSEPASPANDDKSADGDMGNGVTATATEAALSLIQTLLTLF
jgi:hypothetical protein